VASSPAGVVSRSGTPPAADTRDRPTSIAVSGTNTMVPSSLQSPPRPFGASHNVTTAPPVMETFFSLPSAKNAIHCASGEKKGPNPPSVPARGTAAS
jgi:hypothetical protein